MNTHTFVNSYDIFSTFLTACDIEGKGYVYVKPTSEYKIFYKAKSNLDLNKQGFIPLTLKEIVHLGYKFKQEIITQSDPDRNEVILKFKSMGERKQQNERNKNRLVAFICRIWDRVKNFFQGYGFKTTANLSIELSLWLEKNKKDMVKPKEEDKISDVKKIDDNNISKIEVNNNDTKIDDNHIKVIKNDITEIKDDITDGSDKSKDNDTEIKADIIEVNKDDIIKVKNNNIEVDTKNPKTKSDNIDQFEDETRKKKVVNRTGSFLQKKDDNWNRLIKNKSNMSARASIVRELTYFSEADAEKADPKGFEKDPTISVEGLLRHITKTEKGKEIDFGCDENRKDIDMVINLIVTGMGRFVYDFVVWIEKNPMFNVITMKSIINSIYNYYKDNNVFDAEAAQLLMTFYMENKWNETLDSNDQPILPTNDPLIIATSAMLFEKPATNNDSTWEFLTWIGKNSAFDVFTTKSWIDVLVKKEVKFGVFLETPIRKLLVKNLFGSRNDILDDLKKQHVNTYAQIQKHFTYDFVVWMKKQSTFSVTEIKDLFSLIDSLYKETQLFNSEAVQLLMIFYMENKYNELSDSNNKFYLPTDDKLIIEISSMLLLKPAKDENKRLELITWMIENSAFNSATVKSWVNSLIKRESQQGKAVDKPVLELLTSTLKNSRKDILKELPKNSKFRDYIDKKTENANYYNYTYYKKLMDKKE